MAGKLPSLKSLVGAPAAAPAAAPGGLPTIAQLTGGRAAHLPTLAELTAKPPVGSPTPHTGGGGILGGIEHAAGAVGHVIAKTGEGLATDAYNLPGGLYGLGKLETSAIKHDVEHPDLGKHESLHDFIHGSNNPASHQLGQVEAAQVKSVETSAEHPLRAPDQTLLNLFAIASAGAGGAARIGAAADVARGGGTVADVAKAILTKPPVEPRLLTVGDKQIPLQPSRNALMRDVQTVHDKIAQHMIDTKPESRVASYATKRAGGSLAETRRYQQAMQEAPAKTLTVAGKKLDTTEQAALRLTSENTLPDDRMALHQAQADAGVNPAENLKQVKLMEAVKARGLVTKDVNGNATIDAVRHPELAHVDQLLAGAGKARDEILSNTVQMDEAGLATRRDAPAKIVAGGRYVDQPVTDAAKAAAELEQRGQLSLAPRTVDEAVGKGVAGGDTAAPGRNYVPYFATEAKSAKAGVTASSGNVVGKIKNLISKNKPFTGDSLLEGNVRDNTTGLVARQLQRAYRYQNTDQFRRDIATAGSDSRQTMRDILVNTQELKNAKVPDELRAKIGDKNLTLEELAGHRTGFDAFRQRIFPGLDEKTEGAAAEKAADIGTKAPDGFKWVDRNLLGDLGAPVRGAPSKLARAADTVNAAQTAATVYFKLGHVATRAGTNAVTNIVQGSAGEGVHALAAATRDAVFGKKSVDPEEITHSFRLWQALNPGERDRALAAVGQGAFHALPREGEGAVGAVARKGAGFWAHRFDTPFRFNSLAYEARQAGFDTPAKFRDLLDKLENPHDHNMNAAQAAKVDWVAKRADRESIAYDRLNEVDKRYLNRAFWFWPWVKGATRFAGNTMIEHPFKSAAAGVVGAQGAKQEQADLGALPSYERGLFKVGGTIEEPTVMNADTLSPFSTPAQFAESVMHANKPTQAEQFSSYLNPAAGMLTRALFHLDEYGNLSKKGVLSNALSGVGSTTPEVPLFEAYSAKPGSASRKMFPPSKRTAFEKFLFGSAVPRKMNRPVANASARKETTQAGR